jgi:hypothetical protein
MAKVKEQYSTVLFIILFSDSLAEKLSEVSRLAIGRLAKLEEKTAVSDLTKKLVISAIMG